MRRQLMACLTIGLIAAAASAEILEHIVYTPTSLPSEQGWEFVSLHFEESEVASIQDGVLVFDTMAGDVGGSDQAWYVLELTDYPDADFVTVTVRTRIADYEYAAGSWHMAFSLAAIYFVPPNPNPWFGLAPAHVWLNGETIVDHDGTAWHDYTVTIDIADNETHELAIDGTVIGDFSANSGTSYGHAVIVGDRGTFSNARAEIAMISVVISSGAPVAVEPMSLSAIKALFVE